MGLCVCVCTHVCVVGVYMHVCMCSHMHTCMHMHVHVCGHACTYVRHVYACALIVLCTWVVLYAQTVVLCVELIQCSIVSSCTSLFIRGFILVCDVSLLAHV